MLENTLLELFHKSKYLEKERGAATESEDPAAAASENRLTMQSMFHSSECLVDEPFECGLTSRS